LGIGGPDVVIDQEFLGVEIFGDGVNLLFGFGQKGEKRRCFIDRDGGQLGCVLLGVTIRRRSMRGEFRGNLGPEIVRFLICEQSIPFRCIN